MKIRLNVIDPKAPAGFEVDAGISTVSAVKYQVPEPKAFSCRWGIILKQGRDGLYAIRIGRGFVGVPAHDPRKACGDAGSMPG
ncbi:MAG TPA: hypothetical protein VLR50_18400 [Desulfobacterales bacterium]|nr:hypothetical protein [Desulfobacterales bacterium]